ncbi:MAG: DUF4097 family beta strand repeat protein [Acidobacteria bacterium]|nr:DUF4097 family beta strand repeat protein [Acidobacteriota bacterium]
MFKKSCFFIILLLMAGIMAWAAVNEDTFAIPANGRVYVKTVSGNITVTGWTHHGEVLVRWEVDGKNVEPVFEETADGLIVKEDHLEKGFMESSGSIHFELFVPMDAVLDGKSVSGDIRCDGAFADIELNTVSGEIAAFLEDPNNASLKSVSGDLFCTVRGAFSTHLHLKSVSGDVELALPREASCQFSAKTISGRLSCQADLAEKHEKEGIASKKLSGILGSGEGEITATTISGNISVN